MPNTNVDTKLQAKGTEDDHIHTLSVMTCVEVLTQAGISRRLALQNELAVGLGIFFESGKVNKESKGMLQMAYARSGYDCAEHTGKDYKTVMRRLGATALLFDKIGFETLRLWIGHSVEIRMVYAIVDGLKPSMLNSIDDVLTYVGKPRVKAVEAEGAEGEAEAETGTDPVPVPESELDEHPEGARKPAYKVDTKHMHLDIPVEATAAELMELAQKILKLATKLEQKMLQLTGASPSA